MMPGDGLGNRSARRISSLAAPIFQPAPASPDPGRRSDSSTASRTATTESQSLVRNRSGSSAACRPRRAAAMTAATSATSGPVSGLCREHGGPWPGGVGP